MNKSTETIEDYKLTDPDNLQFGRQISANVFKFKEFDRSNGYNKTFFESLKDDAGLLKKVFNTPEHWIKMEIDIANYKNLEEIVSGYYNNLDEVKETYGDDWKWIVAECVFEQESGNY